MSWVNKKYAVAKSIDQYTRMYVTPLPNESIDVGRPMKTTPIYDKLKDMGAVYLDTYGWEKPIWFSKPGTKEKYSFKRSNAFPYVQKECENIQKNVGILDLSTFAKYEIKGKDSEAYLFLSHRELSIELDIFQFLLLEQFQHLLHTPSKNFLNLAQAQQKNYHQVYE